MYSPSRTFLTELKRLDKNLGCYYNQDHEHFVITYRRASGQPVPVLLIEGLEGEFRFPNMRDIETLQKSDMAKMRLKDRLQRVAHHFEETRRKTRERSRDMIRQETIENRRQLMPRFARLANEGGKHNSTFRRIKLRQRGLTIKQIQASR